MRKDQDEKRTFRIFYDAQTKSGQRKASVVVSGKTEEEAIEIAKRTVTKTSPEALFDVVRVEPL